MFYIYLLSSVCQSNYSIIYMCACQSCLCICHLSMHLFSHFCHRSDTRCTLIPLCPSQTQFLVFFLCELAVCLCIERSGLGWELLLSRWHESAGCGRFGWRAGLLNLCRPRPSGLLSLGLSCSGGCVICEAYLKPHAGSTLAVLRSPMQVHAQL